MQGVICSCSWECVSQELKPDVVKVCCTDDEFVDVVVYRGLVRGGIYQKRGVGGGNLQNAYCFE